MQRIAHEVIKRVGRRAYRYRVESYRDPGTRKVRSRWTYLGVAADPSGGEGAPAPVSRRATSAETRERLITAFEHLVETLPYSAVTAGMVATGAGLAHGTFYRYFADKRAVFLAAIDRKREQLQATRPSFEPPYGSLEAERARVRAWAEAVLLGPPHSLGVIRAFFEALEGDEDLREMRRSRSVERVDAFARYLIGLTADARIIDVPEPEALATALFALMDAVFREAVISGKAADAVTVSGVVAVFDRAIFRTSGAISATEMREPEAKTK
jgi:AcrR family transcriptional regulator